MPGCKTDVFECWLQCDFPSVLQAWVEEELLIYEAFPFQASDSSAADQRLKLRFKKFDHGLILKERARGRQRRKGDEEEEEDLSHLDKILRLRCFNDVSGYSGVGYSHFLTCMGDV